MLQLTSPQIRKPRWLEPVWFSPTREHPASRESCGAGNQANFRAAIEKVSARLGNTPAICRKCYIHPEVLDAYLCGSLLLEIREEVDQTLKSDLASLSAEEAAVLALLRQRLQAEPVTTN